MAETRSGIWAGTKAGLGYFAIVFAAGFALGVGRTLVLSAVPQINPFAAVLVELPIILGIAWLACGLMLRRSGLSADYQSRIVMGLTAFGALMIAEALLSISLNTRTLGEHFALYAEPSHLAGLGGQIVFALFPLVRQVGKSENGKPRSQLNAGTDFKLAAHGK